MTHLVMTRKTFSLKNLWPGKQAIDKVLRKRSLNNDSHHLFISAIVIIFSDWNNLIKGKHYAENIGLMTLKKKLHMKFTLDLSASLQTVTVIITYTFTFSRFQIPYRFHYPLQKKNYVHIIDN